MDRPKLINLNIAALQYFIAVAETGSFSKAAALMHTVQPNISRQIQALETELGVRLFERTPSGTLLTAAGERCLEKSRQIVRLASSLTDEHSSLRGRLRIGFTSNSFSSAVNRYSEAFSRSHPLVELSITQGPLSELKAALLAKQLDILFVFSSAFPPQSEFARKTISPARLNLIVPASHRFFARTSVHIAELAKENVMLCGNMLSSFALDTITRYAQDTEILPEFSFTSYEDDLDGMLERVRRGDGIFMTAFRLPSDTDPSLKVVELDYDYSTSNWDLVALWRTDDANPCLDPFLHTAMQK